MTNTPAQLTPTTHSRFSPSGSKRWILCPGSIPFVESLKLPHRDSEFANEGTACHELAAHCLQNQILDAREFENVVFYKDIPTNLEMIAATNEYVAYILSFMHEGSTLEVEKRVSMSALYPEMGGTSDAFIWSKKEFHCFDLKYGKGVPVEVEENYQLMLYAAGRIRELHQAGLIDASKLDCICLHIIQPRAPHNDGPCRKWYCHIDDLRAHWLRADGAIKLSDSDNPPIVPGAEQCQWCDGAPLCKKLAEHNMKTAMSDFAHLHNPRLDLIQANTLSQEDLAAILKHSDVIESWIKSIVTFAQFQLERKIPVPGFKLVRGRSNRGWANGAQEAIIKFVTGKGFKKEDLFSEPKFKSPNQIETLIGKKEAEALKEYVVKPQGKITIAPSSDKRDEVFKDDTASADFAAFGEASDDE